MTFCEKSVHRVASSWRIQKNLLYRRIYQYRERTRIIQRVVTFHIVVIIEHIVAKELRGDDLYNTVEKFVNGAK